MSKNRKPLCGCGYGVATHPCQDMEGLVLHVLGEGSCCRMIATGDLIPTNFRMEVWTSYEGTEHENTFLTEVCTVNNQTVTKYTLTDQRGYNYNKEFGIWSLPKSRESTNSIGDNW
jgi:hypothetical protein